MVDFSKIMALSEATNGFNGGSYVDEMPNYTLDEAVCYLPMMIMESQMEQYDTVAAQNELIVEAVVSSVQTGDNSSFESITEAGIKGLWEKAKATFEKIGKFLSTIIAKIKAFIVARKAKSEEFYKKYAEKIDPAKCEGKTFTGYSFEKTIKLNADIDKILSDVYGSAYAHFDANKSSGVEALTDDHAGRMRQVASKATGIELANQDWSNELTGKLYDDNKKSEMKYGEKCFKLEEIKKTLTDMGPVNELSKGYEKMLTDVKSKINQVGTYERAEENEKDSDRYKYLNNYITAYSEVHNALASVQAIAKKYYDSKWTQATQMLMVLAGSAKKAKEEKPAEEKPEDNKPEEKKEEK